MNSFISNKVQALLLLVVMVLNPLVSAAGSLVVVSGTQDSMNPHQAFSAVDSSKMDMAKCHETGDQSSVINLAEQPHGKHTNTDSLDCCDELCMCAQGGCHASLTMNFDANFTYSTGIISASYNGGGYLNPILNSLTPPPIA